MSPRYTQVGDKHVLVAHYTIEECRANGGHVSVGRFFESCYRCTVGLVDASHENDPDRAVLVARIEDVPDPLARIPGARR